MIKHPIFIILVSSIVNLSCNNAVQKKQGDNSETRPYKEGTFGYDLHFLKQYDSLVVLQTDNQQSLVIVSPKYQAKVFTSTAAGEEGLSFGWVNYKAFSAPPDAHMNAYGGENRLWLGPEGGRFSLFFRPGSNMVFENWKTPAPIDTEAWRVTNKSSTSVALQKEMGLINYKGNKMEISVDRSINILTRLQANNNLGLTIDSGVKAVGYETVNVLTNKGSNAWTEATGMPCIWILDMFKPTAATVIVVPFKNAAGRPFNEVANTTYFGAIPADRLKHTNDMLYFKADGKKRGKLGIVPQKALPVAGSYDSDNKVLTIAVFNVEPGNKYLNQEWNTAKAPFSGDAMNVYNDGPLEDGSQMGPFYEIESVSPAAFLQPKQSLTHKHSVYHFTASEPALDRISRKVLGVSLNAIKNAF